jgi:hypothetical protein
MVRSAEPSKGPKSVVPDEFFELEVQILWY